LIKNGCIFTLVVNAWFIAVDFNYTYSSFLDHTKLAHRTDTVYTA